MQARRQLIHIFLEADLGHWLVSVVLGWLVLQVVSDILLQFCHLKLVVIILLVGREIYFKLVKAVVGMHPPRQLLSEKRRLDFEGGFLPLVVLEEICQLRLVRLHGLPVLVRQLFCLKDRRLLGRFSGPDQFLDECLASLTQLGFLAELVEAQAGLHLMVKVEVMLAEKANRLTVHVEVVRIGCLINDAALAQVDVERAADVLALVRRVDEGRQAHLRDLE